VKQQNFRRLLTSTEGFCSMESEDRTLQDVAAIIIIIMMMMTATTTVDSKIKVMEK